MERSCFIGAVAGKHEHMTSDGYTVLCEQSDPKRLVADV
jgi:hypothetical protein